MTDTSPVTARDELYEIAEVLREADAAEKAGKTLKEEMRGPFLDLISEVVREEIPLIRTTVTVTAEALALFENDYERWRAQEWPEWNLIAVSPTPDGTSLLMSIEENDAYKKFEFTHGGYKYGRTLSMVGASFLADAMYEALAHREIEAGLRKALLDTITVQIVTTYTLDEAAAATLMANRPETVAIFQEFSTPGKPQVRLLPIKPSKEDQ